MVTPSVRRAPSRAPRVAAALVCWLGVAALGCGGDAREQGERPTGQAGRGIGDGASGTAAPAPTLAALAAVAAQCPWRGGLSIRCDAYARFLDAATDPTPEAERVWLDELGASDRRIRYVAASALVRRGGAFRTDPRAHEAIVRAAESEPEPALQAVFGSLVARLEGDEEVDGLRLRWATDAPHVPFRASLLGDWLGAERRPGRPRARAHEATARAMHGDPDPSVRQAAAASLWLAADVPDDAARRALCGGWLARVRGDADGSTRDRAAYLLGTWRGAVTADGAAVGCREDWLEAGRALMAAVGGGRTRSRVAALEALLRAVVAQGAGKEGSGSGRPAGPLADALERLARDSEATWTTRRAAAEALRGALGDRDAARLDALAEEVPGLLEWPSAAP